MGLRLPDGDIEHGLDCTFCRDAPYFRWPAGETPLYTYARFTGLVKCPGATYDPPNGQIFTLTQDPLTPCRWTRTGDVWDVVFYAWGFFAGWSTLQLWDETGDPYFDATGAKCPQEGIVYNNGIGWCIPGAGAHSGIASIDWGVRVRYLAEAMGIPYDPQLMSEIHHTAGGVPVFKYCNVEYSTNLKMKYEP